MDDWETVIVKILATWIVWAIVAVLAATVFSLYYGKLIDSFWLDEAVTRGDMFFWLSFFFALHLINDKK